jgi:hypothetical protein
MLIFNTIPEKIPNMRDKSVYQFLPVPASLEFLWRNLWATMVRRAVSPEW